MAKQRSETWRPSPELELMLRAATGDGDVAREAWNQWLAAVATKSVDDGSQRFYPLLYRNLQKLGIEHPDINRFALSYRNVWARNQMVMRNLEEVLADFEQVGIPTLVLKGAALLTRYYKDMGTRSMADFDVLVPVAQTDAAIARLTERGWKCTRPLSLITAEYRAPLNGMSFSHEKKSAGCDLHWYILHLQLNASYDAPMWEAAVPIQIGNTQSLRLRPEHQLIHTLFIGCMNEANTNKRWLPDALVLLKNETALDWTFVVSECRRLHFVPPAAAMLDYLRNEWKMPVPAEAVTALANTPVPYYVQQAYRALDMPKNDRSGMQAFWLLYTEYTLSRPQAKRIAPLDFMRFLGSRWSLDGNLRRTLNYAFLRLRGVSGRSARSMVRE